MTLTFSNDHFRDLLGSSVITFQNWDKPFDLPASGSLNQTRSQSLFVSPFPRPTGNHLLQEYSVANVQRVGRVTDPTEVRGTRQELGDCRLIARLSCK